MLELLDIINDEDLSIYREEGQQPMNLWEEDETIGWVYQYYNSSEEISAMREASGVPRNSRELAVRNQFFTPRYVVQFLVENSLGRQWLEMTKGQTSLVNDCQYMVKREQEIFLNKGEVIPEAKIEGANYIEYRALKDPREILMLDPACGSMHFGLYCFDLFEQIYTEAWDNHSELMPDLRDKYLREDYIKRIPGYILQYNIHGVDIDPRAIQIAGLSLWLRAQKSYKKLGLHPADRPMIKKSNLVVAEPMPGDAELLSEFTRSLPGPIGKLVRVIWDKMQLAGETGLLLKIEEELKNEIEIAKEEYKQYKGGSTQTSIFGGVEDVKTAEMAAIYGKDQKITKDFFDTAEEEVLKALQSFSENAEGEHAFQKLLFAEDTASGFAFIELCRKRYDVIVMNPPFGEVANNSLVYIKSQYPNFSKNIIVSFTDRTSELLAENGKLGAIVDKTIFIKSSYQNFRDALISSNFELTNYCDLGWGILDGAQVETACYTINNGKSYNPSAFFDCRVISLKKLRVLPDRFKYKHLITKFHTIPNYSFAYDFPEEIWANMGDSKSFEPHAGCARQGLGISDSWRWYRHKNEIKINQNGDAYKYLVNGGGFSPYYRDLDLMIFWKNDGKAIKATEEIIYGSSSRTVKNTSFYFQKGICFPKRTFHLNGFVFPVGCVFSSEGLSFFMNANFSNGIWDMLALFNSKLESYVINRFCGQHKSVGYVKKLPMPVNDLNLNESKKIANIKFIFSQIVTNSNYFNLPAFVGFEKFLSALEIVLKNEPNELNILEQINYFNDSASFTQKIDVIEKFIFELNRYINLQQLVIDAKVNNDFNIPVEGIDTDSYTARPDLYVHQGIIEDKILRNKFWSNDLLSYLTGLLFARWNLPSNTGNILLSVDDYLGSDIPFISPNHNDVPTYESKVLSIKDGRFNIVPDLDKEIESLFNKIMGQTSDSMFSDFLEELNTNSLYDYFRDQSSSGFFDFHFNRNSLGRRMAPYYWFLSSSSGKFSICLYYPALNENTLFSNRQ